MHTYIALLRSVNVGGTAKLPMSDLARMCRDIGFEAVRTYIASGNVIFNTDMSPEAARISLEERLYEYCGKMIRVHIRTPYELSQVIAGNPFAQAEGNKVVAFFLDKQPEEPGPLTGQKDEEISAGTRELYVHYPSGIGRSKLVLPGSDQGTARNMNTLTKLLEIARTP